jgi:hypothetical protein
MGACVSGSSLRALSKRYAFYPDTAIAKQLVDKMYEKRKAAALDLEKYSVSKVYLFRVP